MEYLGDFVECLLVGLRVPSCGLRVARCELRVAGCGFAYPCCPRNVRPAKASGLQPCDSATLHPCDSAPLHPIPALRDVPFRRILNSQKGPFRRILSFSNDFLPPLLRIRRNDCGAIGYDSSAEFSIGEKAANWGLLGGTHRPAPFKRRYREENRPIEDHRFRGAAPFPTGLAWNRRAARATRPAPGATRAENDSRREWERKTRRGGLRRGPCRGRTGRRGPPYRGR